MSTTEEFLGGGGGDAAEFSEIGSEVGGTVISVEKRQLRNFAGTELETWPDGGAKYTWLVTVETDDGPKTIFCRGQMFTAVREAAVAAGITEMVGATLRVRHTGLGTPTVKGYREPKLYAAKWEPGVAPTASVTVDEWI